MAEPNTRAEFREYCLRRLGKPAIEINITEDQIEDRIDDALRYYYDYHFDGSEKIYYKHQVTAQNIADKYIDMPENVLGVVNIFDVGSSVNTNNLFNYRYQMAMSDLYTFSTQSMIPFYMAMTHIALIQELLVGKQPIRYNRHINKLYVDMDWNKLNVGDYLVVEAYHVVDPAVYPDVWKDRWLKRYATALMKQQWGSNLTKFIGMTLPGGVQFNGERILDDATAEITKLEDEMINTYSLPVSDMIG